MRKHLFLATFLTAILAVGSIAFPVQNKQETSLDNLIESYFADSYFHVEVKRAGTDTWQDLGNFHNVITATGRDHFKWLIGQNNTAIKPGFGYIAFGNFSNASTSSTPGHGLLNESGVSDLGPGAGATASCGFGRNSSQVTFVNQVSNGNWSKTIIATNGCSYPVVLNASALYNDSRTSNTASHQNFTFASANFTGVTLQANDQLNVTWIINATG